MYLTYHCPRCDELNRSPDVKDCSSLKCSQCDWERELSEHDQVHDGSPHECIRCGNSDLWRQKNFPQSLGLIVVALGAITSGIAWANYRPNIAYAILMFVALLDMFLYIVMPDVLVCYRCKTKHHDADTSQHAAFDHELGEKYRQEEIRRREADGASPPVS